MFAAGSTDQRVIESKRKKDTNTLKHHFGLCAVYPDQEIKKEKIPR